MKADANRLRQAIATPAAVRLYLLHGADEAAAQAAAQRIGQAMGADAERVDLDGAMLRKEPGRLADEAASPTLFGTPRYIRVSGVGEESIEALTLLLAAEHVDAPVIALAPTVRTTAKIVALAIASPQALACVFYPPTIVEAERIAAGLAREEGLQVEPGVARRLAETTSGDQALLASEVAKLALYLDAAPDRPQPLDHAALDALGADHGEAALPGIVASLIDGEPELLGGKLDQLTAEGASPVPWLRAVQRRLLALSAMRAAIDAGESPAAVMKKNRVFFREEAATLAALRRWSPVALARALHQTREAERASMGGSTAGAVIANAAAVAMARGIAERR